MLDAAGKATVGVRGRARQAGKAAEACCVGQLKWLRNVLGRSCSIMHVSGFPGFSLRVLPSTCMLPTSCYLAEPCLPALLPACPLPPSAQVLCAGAR